ncbi:MauE/DoxX family redox-associated membrane protein [Actinomycetota bacterium]
MTIALLAACALVLVASGLSHLRDLAVLRRGMREHGVLPESIHAPAAIALTAAELVLAAALAFGLVVGSSGVTRLAAAGAAALFAAFTAYLLLALRRPGAAALPCACGLGDAPLGLWTVVRAALLAALAVIGAVWVPAAAGTLALPQLAVVLLATVSLAIGIGLLPAARAVEVAR